jgi:hypothetical protein
MGKRKCAMKSMMKKECKVKDSQHRTTAMEGIKEAILMLNKTGTARTEADRETLPGMT